MNKRLVFKPWTEKVLTWVFIISFMLMVGTEDFEGIEGLLGFLSIILITVVSGWLLVKYGRNFK